MALLSSLRKLLSGSPATPVATAASGNATPAPARRAAAAESPAGVLPQAAGGLGLAFSQRLLGLEALRPGELEPSEQALLTRLQAQLQDGRAWMDSLPRLPALLPQLMSLARREDVSARELVALLSRDPSLVGELLRLANSPRYRSGREITDLQSAVMVLGQQGLNQLVMSVALRPIYSQSQGRFARQAGTLPWDMSERCAQACVLLAGAGQDGFAAYLCGLSAQVGLMALLRMLDAQPGLRRAPAAEAFHRQWLLLAAHGSAQVAQHWGLPPLVCAALAEPPRSAQATVLAQLLQQGQALALQQLLHPGQEALAQTGGWSSTQLRCLAELERQFPAAHPAD